jgi:acetylornithine deacetylase/succinyl-diaminopimelate desuccinylase-like protein
MFASLAVCLVSDDKGPILAAIFAVSELINERSLGCNVFFLIEGEEESGSTGFFEAVEQNRVSRAIRVPLRAVC